MLIIEDDELTQKIYKRIFRNEFETDFAISSEEYHNKYDSKKYDIVIIDISLKGTKNGIEMIMDFKKNPLFEETPLLCITAHALIVDKVKALNAGADVYLTKPIDNNVLRNTVASLLKKIAL